MKWFAVAKQVSKFMAFITGLISLFIQYCTMEIDSVLYYGIFTFPPSIK